MNAETRIQFDNISLSTEIQSLGRASVPSPMPAASLIDSEFLPLYVDKEVMDELNDHEPVPLLFEAAGPRGQLYFDPSKAKCAVVTCGGLCPGINDVIRAIVMEAHHKYRIPTVLGIKYGLEGFIPKYAHDVEELTPKKVTDIHQFGGTILGSSRGPQAPAEIVDALERMNISCLFMIGGDGTMKATQAIVREVAERNLRVSVIGIPKTIDNDINFISQSFGFETAVFKATEAIQCAHTEALGYKNGIGLVKLMGRESGFIAAHATLAMKEVNFVLIPEIPFALHGEGGLLQALETRLRGRKHAVIVAAEGAGQHLLESRGETDPSGNVTLADVADVLKREIKQYLNERGVPFSMKYIDPSYIIRSVPANANDKVYCGFLGQNAVHAAMAGKTNMVVAKLMDRYVHLPLELVTSKRRKLNVHSAYWQAVLESTGQPELATL
ncbi:ATP-dependent 6-phosphofructokinase [Desulfovibrio sp. OttesenSCG-928-A18]|nr:ATP-dependent 6-phosphofructokinase [Desulfovibrio sp. OttesenSCG-928-A18]